MDIFIEEVIPNKEKTLQNMFEYYDYEFSPYLNFEVNPDGLFRKAEVKKYLSDNSYDAYLIRSHNTILGFVIVKKTASKPSFEIEQFFILKKYIGKGIGKQAAFKIFDLYIGNWKVTQIENNYPAQAFWRSVIKQYSNDSYNESYDEKRTVIQEFKNY